MIKTMGVQPFDFSDPSPYVLMDAISDILDYLSQEITVRDGYAFLNRKNIFLDAPFDGTTRNKQYYVNGLLITGLLELIGNDEFSKIEKKFDELVSKISDLLEIKLKTRGVDSTHTVFVEKDEDYGDVVIGFWKKGSE